MAKENGMRQFSASELKRMRAGGESLTDHERLQDKTDADVEHDNAADPDFRGVPQDWYRSAVAVMPVEKKLISLRLDRDVIERFRSQGPGYQTRINAVLRAYLDHTGQRARGGKSPP